LPITTLPTPFTHASLSAAIKPAITSKQFGDEDLLAGLVAEAALLVMPQNPKNFNVDNVRVVKIMGSRLANSRVVPGMVFGREPEGMIGALTCVLPVDSCAGIVKKVTRAKVAVFTSALDVAQTETKGTVLLKNAGELLNFSRGEEDHLRGVRRLQTKRKILTCMIRRL
jgi:T-complex protein 1 subunit theta